MEANFVEVLSRFDRLRAGTRPNLWNCSCPCKDRHKNGDRTPSARVWIEEDTGRMSFWCAKGCRWTDVIQATGLRKQDWFPPKESGNPNQPRRASVGFSAVYDYTDRDGNLLYQVCRTEPKSFVQRRPMPGTKGEFAYSLAKGHYLRNTVGGWEPGPEGKGLSLPEVKKTIYRLPEVVDPVKKQKDWPVIVVEGEKDVESLRAIGLIATCNSGGAGKWLPEYGSYLHGRRVVVIADNDAPGVNHACLVAASAIGHNAASIKLWAFERQADLGGEPVPEGLDVTDWLDRLDVSQVLPAQRAAEKRRLLVERIRTLPEWKAVKS